MSAELKRNAFKVALSRQERQIGIWSSLSSPIVAELLSGAGYDWILFDGEHGPVEVADMLALLHASQSSPTSSAVRVAANDPVLFKRILDLGAQTVFVPFIQNAAEARAAVDACRYPPLGLRGVSGASRASGYGRVPSYHARASEGLCLVVQVETQNAIGEIERIAAVEGVDGIFIGPSDLAASMGFPGCPDTPEVQEMLRGAAETIRGCGRSAGILARGAEDAQRYIGWGFNFVAAAVDVSLLVGAADRLRQELLV